MVKNIMTIQDYLSWKNIFPPVVTIDSESCTNAYECMIARIVNGMQLYGSYERSGYIKNDPRVRADVYDKYNIYSSELVTMLQGEFGFLKERLEAISVEDLKNDYKQKFGHE